MKQFTLSARERMKSRKQIDRLFSSGRSINLFPIRVVYLAESASVTDDSGLRFGVSVPARHFKKATDRNLIKRQLREFWRTQNLLLKERTREKNLLVQVFVVFSAREKVDQKLLRDKMNLAIEKLIQEADALPV